MDPVLQLNEFFVEGGNQVQSHVLLHITEPSTPEEQAKGYFFAICEINNAAPKYITKLQDIIDNAENAYYETEPQGEKTALEVILEKINQEAFALIDDEVELHCIIGAIFQPHIIFTYHGHPQALLFYRNKQGAYQKMDLVAQNPEDPSVAKTQLFSDVIQGKISTFDYLFLSTPHLTNYFTHDRIQKVITARPANLSAQHFEHVLSELREGYSFGGLVVHLHKPADIIPAAKKYRVPEKGGSEKSMQSLFTTERNTAATLSPSLFPHSNEARTTAPTPPMAPPKFTAEVNSSHAKPHRPLRRSDANASNDRILTILRRVTPALTAVGKGLLWVALMLYSGIASILRTIALLFFAATNYQNRRKAIVDEWRRHWRGRKENFRQLPLITKIIFCIIILVILGFAGGLSYTRYKAREQATLQAYQDTLNQIKTKRDAAESNLIYRNEAAAITELQSAEQLLASLPCVSKEEKTNCLNLQNDLAALATRLRKITAVTPELLTTIPSFASSTAALVKIDSVLYIAGSGSNSIMSYDLSSHDTKIAVTGSQGVLAMTAPKENDYIFLELLDHSFQKLDPKTNQITTTTISFPNLRATIGAMLVYNRKLYTLDTANSQIYKHTTIRDGFDLGKEWIKTPGANLQNGVSMTVDGDMYILGSGGQVTKFTSGELQNNFTLQGLDPALTSGDRIFTYTDVNNIYILDSTSKRLIITDKTGLLKQQITSPSFSHPTDMIIDEPGKTAYIIDNGRLFKIPLTF